MNIVFVLLTYGPDEPAGIERSIAALAAGLRQRGHRPYVLAAGPAAGLDGLEIIRLSSITLPRPATEDDLMTAIWHAPGLADEVRACLRRVRAGLVVWADATWGLGYLAPSAGVPAALMVRVLRTDTFMTQALAHQPVQILTNSDFLTSQATAAGLDTRCWHAVPNALLTDGVPPPGAQRDRQRLSGPIRIVARAEPHKGIAELIEACPADLDRPVEIVLADAAFEYWPGMQREVISTCHRLAATRAAVRLYPVLPWQVVQPFLADAACTIISSTSPETFCNTALEALSVATPVVTFDLGHVPRLIGQAGVVVPTEAGAAGLWDAAGRLLADPAAYQAASAAGPPIAACHTPAAAADAFLSAVAAPEAGLDDRRAGTSPHAAAGPAETQS